MYQKACKVMTDLKKTFKLYMIFSFFKYIKRDKIQKYILKCACFGSKVHSIKNNKFIVTTLSKCSCMFKELCMGMEMTYLHDSTMIVTRLHVRVYKVWTFWTRLPSIPGFLVPCFTCKNIVYRSITITLFLSLQLFTKR